MSGSGRPGEDVPDEREVLLFWSSVGEEEPATDALSAAELRRAERFHQDRDRRRYLARQSFLRTTLGRCLGRPPASLAFVEGPHGKPALAGAAAEWAFNLSHSAGLVLLAIARRRAVGVDLERIRPLPELAGMAESTFTPGELAAFHATPAPQRLSFFFELWTRKEAALKALGDGFSRDPRTLEVGPRPLRHEPLSPLPIEGEPALAGYSLLDLDAPPDFAAALCAEGDVRCRTPVVP